MSSYKSPAMRYFIQQVLQRLTKKNLMGGSVVLTVRPNSHYVHGIRDRTCRRVTLLCACYACIALFTTYSWKRRVLCINNFPAQRCSSIKTTRRYILQRSLYYLLLQFIFCPTRRQRRDSCNVVITIKYHLRK